MVIFAIFHHSIVPFHIVRSPKKTHYIGTKRIFDSPMDHNHYSPSPDSSENPTKPGFGDVD